MKMDLREIFRPATVVPDDTKQITTIICDVYDTLIKDKKFNQALAEFLRWADENGAAVLIASSLKSEAEKDIRRLDTKGLLSSIAIHDKGEIQSWFYREDPDVLAVDDQTLIWLGAALLYGPGDPALEKILQEKSYRSHGLVL